MMDNFDDLRPYIDSEISLAMKRIASSSYLAAMTNFVFPDKTVSEVREMLLNIHTIEEFQFQVMYYFNKSVINNSIRDFTFSGIDRLDPGKCYLFVSNHRDIVLDSSLMQLMLYQSGLRTTEITFGSNLMTSQLVVDIGKSNKMFKVVRGGSIRDFYKNSMRLSEYIRYTISQKKESIWIAQRNGRTKNGNDATDQGIIKMFCMSEPASLINALSLLNIVPVAISYEVEPCDILKTRELYLSRNGQKYVKEDGEDFNSILTGIVQQKGNVHISICEPVSIDDLTFIAENYPAEFHKRVASLIDKRIYNDYKLHSNNYIAHDIRSGKETYQTYYTSEEKERFIQRYEQMLQQVAGEKEVLRSLFLGIYANPVDNSQ